MSTIGYYWDHACESVVTAGFGEKFFVVFVASVVHAVGLWGSCWFFVVLDRLGGVSSTNYLEIESIWRRARRKIFD